MQVQKAALENQWKGKIPGNKAVNSKFNNSNTKNKSKTIQ
jgi:hypothetical protein